MKNAIISVVVFLSPFAAFANEGWQIEIRNEGCATFAQDGNARLTVSYNPDGGGSGHSMWMSNGIPPSGELNPVFGENLLFEIGNTIKRFYAIRSDSSNSSGWRVDFNVTDFFQESMQVGYVRVQTPDLGGFSFPVYGSAEAIRYVQNNCG